MGYPPTTKARARELHKQGKSLAEIAKELGVPSRTTVRMWLIDKPAPPPPPPNSTAQHSTSSTAQPARRRGEHGQSKSKAKEQINEAMLETIRTLEELSHDKPVDMAHPAVTSPDQMAARLEILAWDIATALRAVIPYGDVKQLSGALKISVEMARLIQGKATAIQETRIATTEGDQRREQLASRVRGLDERLRQRAKGAGIRGVVDGGDPPGGACPAAADAGGP